MKRGNSSLTTNNRKFWFIADFETITPNTNYYKKTQDTKVNLWGLQQFGDFSPDKINWGITIEEFIDHLKNLGVSSTIFFHNLAFDGDFIVKYLIKTYPIIKKKDRKTGIAFFKNKNRIYNIILNFRNPEKKFCKIIFRCSLLLLTASVDSLGKAFKIEKHENGNSTFYDFEPFKNKDEILFTPFKYSFLLYMKRDIEIVNRSLVTFEHTINSVKIIKDKNKKRKRKGLPVFNYLTIGALAKHVQGFFYIPKFHKENPQHKGKQFLTTKSKTDYNFIKKNFMYGGWTQYNPLFQNDNNDIFKGVMIDINSSYPSIMVENLPYGDLLQTKPKSTFVEWVTVDVKTAIIKKKYEHFRILKNWKHQSGEVRYSDKLDNFTCYYLKKEWDIINKVYDIKIKSIGSVYQKTAPFLKSLVTDFYALKQKYKKAGDKASEMTFKIFLNSLYGKFNQRDKYDEMNYSTLNFEDFQKDNPDFGEFRESNSYKIDNKHKVYFMKRVKDSSKFTNSAVAAYTTSGGRCKLWNTILKIGVKYFIYSDTDSIAFKTENMKDLHIGADLGEWSIDSKLSQFKVYGAKRYLGYLENEIVKKGFAGVNLDLKKHLNYMNFDFDEFHIPNATLKKTYVKSGIILELKDLDIKKGKQ